MVPDHWKQVFNWDEISPETKEILERFAMYMFTLGRYTVSEIEKIKYDGRLIILADGSRWEVDDSESGEADMWSEMDKVAVIDDEMYNLEHCDKVTVTEED